MKPNILLVGCGPHAKRVYIPALKAFEATFGAQIKLIVDVKAKEQETLKFLGESYPTAETLFAEPSIGLSLHSLPSHFEKKLNSLVERQGINGVIIATDPLNHMQYALWAEKAGLHILMDKPISTYNNVSNSIEQARQISEDFHILMENYSKDKAFIINSQRRFLPQFEVIQNKINEVAKTYGVPITSMQSSHSDGQWRLPNEVINLNYHGYHGSGKVSHSGYHFTDMAGKLMKQSFEAAGKSFNKISVYSSFIRPSGALKMQDQADLTRLFGDEYSEIDNRSDEELVREYIKNQ
jgi:predicted dehydrogenase